MSDDTPSFEVGERVEWRFDRNPRWDWWDDVDGWHGPPCPTIKIGTISDIAPDGTALVEWDRECWAGLHHTERRWWCEPVTLAPLDPATVPTPQPPTERQQLRAEIARVRARLVELGHDPDRSQ